ncbi:GerAB/ArcD/ProY family transporter [Metabacillus halosaccharovorans]|uniref:Spore germination protein n=1 Tax=Metabacillus halosaccharovorans TaxID=930124 RepID=A0ABT3DF84_9BACI|nr:spore germination protein [Metabacillus halosaccharovorans]MCV9885712.1 spore germination protein [Metabacillus halosaccharovorans]
MNTVKISTFQVFSMITLFLLGSTIVVGLGLEVEENAWILNIFSTTVGIGIFFLYTSILKKNDWSEFHVLLEKGFGKFLGKFLLLLYSIYFIYISSRVITDFSYFISQTLFYQIKNWVISIVFIMVVCYACLQGLEAIARASEILFFITMILVVILLIIADISEVISWENIRPFFDKEDFKLSSLFTRITFPYGELIVFTFLFPHLKNKKTLLKRGWAAILLAGFILLIISETIIAILGAKVAAIFTFPLLKAIEMIEFIDIIQHIEIISVFSFFIVGFVKVAIFSIVGTKGFSLLLPKKIKAHLIVYLVGVITFLLSTLMDRNLPEHLFIGLKIIPIYLHLPFQFVIPIILFVTLLVKKKLRIIKD